MGILRQNTINNSSVNSILLIIVISIFAYIQLFYKLDELPLRVWDEGKNAVSAYEMLQNNNFLVRYYEGKPDDWGFKPPLLTWHQVISMKIFGVNVFAVRFPSAMYAFFTAIIIFYFIRSELNSPYIGTFASFVLLTSFGYLERHIARSGDHDSMLTFFLTVQAIYFYKYLKSDHYSRKYLLIITIAIILGSLTKGIAGLFFIPGFVLYALLNKKLIAILINRDTYIAIFFYVIIIGTYYFFREIHSPGYLNAIWENELVPRYSNTASNFIYENKDDYFYYIRNLWNNRLIPWIYIFPIFLITPFISKETSLKSIQKFLVTIGCAYLFIISMGTKNIWYDAPLYPLLAIIISLGAYQTLKFFYELPLTKIIRNSLIILILAPLIYFPIANTKRLTFEVKERPWNYGEQGISYYLINKINNSEQIKNLGIAYSGYHSHILFYANILNNSGSHIYFTDYKNIKTQTNVIASEEKVQKYIEQNYSFEKNLLDNNTVIYKIKQ